MSKSITSSLNLDTKKKGDQRETSTTVREAKEKIREENARLQRERHAGKQKDWKPIKSDIDEMSKEELVEYIKESFIDADAMRLGFMTMKVNPYEYAVIKLSMMQSGARSVRKLLIEDAKKKMTIY